MPTCCIKSLEPIHSRVGDGRKVLSLQIWSTVARILKEPTKDVEAYWDKPIDPHDAWNTTDIWADIEFSNRETDTTLQRLGKAVLAVFDDSAFVMFGDWYGVWIKTPYGNHWAMRERSDEPPSWAGLAFGEHIPYLHGLVLERLSGRKERCFRVYSPSSPDISAYGSTPDEALLDIDPSALISVILRP